MGMIMERMLKKKQGDWRRLEKIVIDPEIYGKGKLFQILTEEELDAAYIMAELRNNESILKNRKNNLNNCGKSDFQSHLEGVIGEIVVLKYLGLSISYLRFKNFKKPDIGRNIEIRSQTLPWADLKININDNPDRVCILVIISQSVCRIVGWCYAREAQSNENYARNYNNDKKSYWMPQKYLHLNIDEIIRENI